jgi:hypothetical protein
MPAILVSLALVVFCGFALSGRVGATHPGASLSRGTALDALEVGQSLSLNEDTYGRWKITLMPVMKQLPYKVVEVGEDYVTVRDVAGITDRLIPIYSIHSIETLLLKER